MTPDEIRVEITLLKARIAREAPGSAKLGDMTVALICLFELLDKKMKSKKEAA